MEQDKIDTMKADAVLGMKDEAARAAICQTIDGLIAEHGEIALVRTAMGIAIFRKPKRMEYKLHLSMLFDEKKRADAIERLARDCVVHPDKVSFSEWLEVKPGIPLVCSDALTKLAGASKDEDEGK